MTSPPTLQTKKPCHSHLLMLPWVQTQVRDITLIFEPTLGSTLHPLIPNTPFSFSCSRCSNKRSRDEVLLD